MSELLQPKRILIADDEDDLTWSISKALQKDEVPFDIISVQDGDAAWQVISNKQIDVVISDIRMPGKNGLELLTDIKKNNLRTQVIVMSAYGSREMREEIIARGARFYIEKPFDMSYMKRLVHEALFLNPPLGDEDMDEESEVAAHILNLTAT